MNGKPLVTIIIPSYNHVKYIEQSVNSALSQTYKNLEIIIVDDGSTDATHDLLNQVYGSNGRVRLVLNKKNRGQSTVMNQGLAIAKGQFVQQLSSDDWLLPDKISLQLEKFEEIGNDVGVVYGRGYRYFEDSKELREVDLSMCRGNILAKLAENGNFIFPMSPLFRREVFDKVSFDESYSAQGEAIYVLISLYYNFDYVDEPVAVMRDHSYNAGKNTSILYEEVWRYWEEFFSNPIVPKEIRKYKKARMRKLHRTKGFQFIGENYDFRMGRRCLLNAVKVDPMLIFDFRVVGSIVFSFLPIEIAKIALRFR